eukprot:10404830-Alexandrium_andersonii.AAC.1
MAEPKKRGRPKGSVLAVPEHMQGQKDLARRRAQWRKCQGKGNLNRPEAEGRQKTVEDVMERAQEPGRVPAHFWREAEQTTGFGTRQLQQRMKAEEQERLG